jgi:hypothetical protein
LAAFFFGRDAMKKDLRVKMEKLESRLSEMKKALGIKEQAPEKVDKNQEEKIFDANEAFDNMVVLRALGVACERLGQGDNNDPGLSNFFYGASRIISKSVLDLENLLNDLDAMTA